MKIEDYAFLSDTQTAALVGRNGSVDWLCFPRFDSASCFAALIGEPKNGRWLIAPSDDSATVTRKYRDDTLILETTFETKHGVHAFAVGDRVQFTDTLKGARIYNGNAGTIVRMAGTAMARSPRPTAGVRAK